MVLDRVDRAAGPDRKIMELELRVPWLVLQERLHAVRRKVHSHYLRKDGH